MCDEARLTKYDDLAHAEAMAAPGFVHYFKGDLTPERQCLSFCLWTSRREARAAAGQTAHREAVTLIERAFERYALEFYRVTKRVGEPSVRIDAYDPVSAVA